MTWTLWLIVAVVFVVFEILTSSIFFCLCFALGATFTTLAAYFFNSSWIEVSTFSIISVLSLYFVRPLFKKMIKKSKTVESNVDAIVGMEAIVTGKIMPSAPGFVKVLGEVWRAEANVEIEEGNIVKVKNINGNTLAVEK